MPYQDILYPGHPKVLGHQITYSFLTSVPDYYPTYYEPLVQGPKDVANAYAIGNSVDNAGGYIPLNPTPTVSLTPGQVGLVTQAIKSWNEVANVNIVPAATAQQQVIGAPITGDGTLMTGIDTAGYLVPRADDAPSALVAIDDVFKNGLNFFGNTYHSLFVNINGSISFGSAVDAYDPSSIVQGTTPMIAPFWADVDTRQNAAQISYGLDKTNHILPVTWPGVDHYDVTAYEHTPQRDWFQLQLYDRGGGGNGVGDDFDIVFRYQSLEWTTGEDFSSEAAHAGWTAGDQQHYFELPQSGNDSAMLGLPGTHGNTQAGTNGLWEWQVRGGDIGIGDIAIGAYNFSGDSKVGAFDLV